MDDASIVAGTDIGCVTAQSELKKRGTEATSSSKGGGGMDSAQNPTEGISGGMRQIDARPPLRNQG